jgi:hypothetical protein
MRRFLCGGLSTLQYVVVVYSSEEVNPHTYLCSGEGIIDTILRVSVLSTCSVGGPRLYFDILLLSSVQDIGMVA